MTVPRRVLDRGRDGPRVFAGYLDPAFFRVDSVTLSKTDCRDGGWMNYGSLFKNQGQCVSLVP